MRVLLVARKSLLELSREWQLALLVVFMPLAFLGIAAMSYSAPMLMTYPLLVMDPGAADWAAELESRRYADGRPVFAITPVANRSQAEANLKEQSAVALVSVSPDGTSATILGDALYGPFYRASTFLEGMLYDYADQQTGQRQVARIVQEPLGGAGPQSEFDVYAPGMIIFALLLIIPQTAMLVAREIRWNTLLRLRLTPMRAGDLLGGIGLAQMVVAVAMVIVIFAGALLLGFHNRGSLLLAIGVGLAVSLSAIGCGLLVSCFVENDSQAINVGSVVAMIMVFVSGSFFELPPLTVFVLGGHQIDLFDIFPATHGFLALQQVLSYGAGLKDAAFRLGATLLLSIAYLAVGVVVFHRLKMRDQA